MRPAAVILVLSGGLAAAVAWHPLAAMAAAGIVSAVLVARCVPGTTERLFLRFLLVVLVGYALFGRTFAGVGARPVYIGEIVLGVGLLSAVANGWPAWMIRAPWLYLMLAFMGWGAVCTIPYLGTYGVNALRDAVIWGYGLFVLLVLPSIIRGDLLWRLPRLYARLVPWIVVVGPAWVFFWVVTGMWSIPGTTMAVPKVADLAPQLAGVAAFLLAGLPARVGASRSLASRWAEWGVWPALVVGIVAVGSLTRGGLVAILAAIGTVAMLEPGKAAKKLLLVGAAALLVGAIWLGWPSTYTPRDRGREINPEQIARNLISIGGGGAEGLEGTREWRLLWWNKIVDYTVHGQYFWTGKGYGINLTYDDGIEADPDNPSRNPHNGNLTFLARSGVPGMVLWVALQLWFAFSMIRGRLRARRAGEHLRASLFAWVLAYWLAVLINASFDPYLETPQGGIWFWCVFAYGIALAIAQPPSAPPRRVVAVPGDRAAALTASGRA